MRFPRAGDVDVIVIGAGHAGLAMSRYLSAAAIDHLVLERGEIANSWRHERWDSLRLLTPNWQSRLPGYRYEGNDPHGYMTMHEVIDFIRRYAAVVDAPVREHTQVTAVTARDEGYRVVTNRGEWRCRALVLASGAHNLAAVPAFASALPPAIRTLTPKEYRNVDALDAGGVLVVGASATGVQLANEIQRSGRQVTLAVGEHIRAPRLYRGRDLEWWMDVTGVLDERYDEIDDIARARKVPSLQLAGTPDRSTLDLNALSDLGVTLVGRFVGLADDKAQFAGSLRNMCAMSDLKMGRLLDTIDGWARDHDLDGEVEPPHRPPPTRVSDEPPLMMNLGNFSKSNVRTIIWATGYRPDYTWLEVPVLDHKGMIRHDGGITASPGLYLMGTPFMRRRKSTLIDGAGDDARELSGHLASIIGARAEHPMALAHAP